ncbi:MAG: sulfatase-like hydrolase/transferase [Bacteroidetes bacterium]|nr:sulfatase-like hydrolase/transferase [Bacteroidota bacterium]
MNLKFFRPYYNNLFFWLLFFAICRLVFLIYHPALLHTLSAKDVSLSFLYGLRMDLSFTGYICILPFLIFLIQPFLHSWNGNRIITIYSVSLIILFSFFTIADLGLYGAWGFRMDATPLQYLKSPKEMGASISSAPLLLLIIIFILLAGTFIFIYYKWMQHGTWQAKGCFQKKYPIFRLILIVILFIPIRGGIQKIPMNISDVYFSKKLFANQAAINLEWNLAFSILNKNSQSNPFNYFSLNQSTVLVKELYNTGTPKIPSILTTERPNIIIIILESFTAKWVGCLGAQQDATPQLDAIAKEGLLFTNIYAAGDRSEKGQVAILSAYPNQAINSIIKIPTKTLRLPAINQPLQALGYNSSYTYGGELEFANIKSYLLNIGIQNLVSKYSFPVSERTTSWGVHDEYVLNEFFNLLPERKQPFFATLFTLSSHEPYDVPIKHFIGDDETTKFKNSIYYTDSIIGNFINKSKQAPWWKNTLIVMVADHGHHLPGNDANDAPSKFHIPLIFTGGALKMKGVVNNIGSQTDIVPTILDQLKIPRNKFVWGKDLLDSSARQFAFYSFNNGFGWVTPQGTITMDNVSKKIIEKSPLSDTTNLKFGKAYMQLSYQDYLDR